MKMKSTIKKRIVIALCIVHINSTSFAMMTTGSRLVPQYARTAAPTLGVAGSQLLNTMSGQPSVNTTYNPQLKNYTSQPTTPDYTKKASDYPAFNQNKLVNNQQPQPQVDMKKAFEYADSYDVNAQDDLQPQINNNPNDQPQQPAFNPNISIAQNLYGKKPAAPNSSPFAQQQRSYSTFRPKSNDPYDILGVSRTATPEQIKEAHRKLVKEYHPDLNQNNKTEATSALQQINDAYEQLTKPNEQNNSQNWNQKKQPIYNSEGFDQDGFDDKGFDKYGYDQFGFNQAGFDKYGDQRGWADGMSNEQYYAAKRERNRKKTEYTKNNPKSFGDVWSVGNEDDIKNYIKNHNIDINKPMPPANSSSFYLYNPLALAIQNFDLSKINLALKLGANVNTTGVPKSGVRVNSTYLKSSPLTLACSIKETNSWMEGTTKYNMITTLLQADADVNALDYEGNNSLLLLIETGFYLPEYLQRNNYYIPKYFITFEQFKDVIQEFIKKDIDINQANKQGLTPLKAIYKNIATRGEYEKEEIYTLNVKCWKEIIELLEKNGAIDTRSTWEKIKSNF